MKQILGLSGYPVGVKFIKTSDIPEGFEVLHKHRYCQGIMKARKGARVMLDGNDISCPAASNAFGFRVLPELLQNGDALVGFGITDNPDTGKGMFSLMPALEDDKYKAILLFPITDCCNIPYDADIVVVEDKAENLMWVALSYINLKKGDRIQSTTSVLQAVCVDATVIPFKTGKMNLSFGCYGCREATDINEGETVLGFPFSDLKGICDGIKLLKKKAVSNSRSKNAFKALNKNL